MLQFRIFDMIIHQVRQGFVAHVPHPGVLKREYQFEEFAFFAAKGIDLIGDGDHFLDKTADSLGFSRKMFA